MAVFALTYIISTLFMEVYSITSLSLLHCFLTDVELTKKGGEGGMADGKHRPKELDHLVNAIRKK